MPIKKSYLEQKWHYRVAKVFFLLLPLLIILIFCTSEKNIIVYQAIGLPLHHLVYIAIGLPLYYLTLKVTWKIFLYIVFGGLEDDTRKKDVVVTQSAGPVIQPTAAPVPDSKVAYEEEKRSSDNGGLIVFLIIIIVLVYLAFSNQSGPSSSPGGSGGSIKSGCTPTGCPTNYPYYGCGKCWATFDLCHSRGTDTLTDDCSVCRKCP